MPKPDKTEKPTAKRKKEARKKGQVAKSTDLNGALVLLAGVFALSAVGPAVVQGIAGAMRSMLARIATPGTTTSASGLSWLEHMAINTILGAVAPIAAVCLATALIANVAQVGFKPSFKAIRPDFKRINPYTGARNLFGVRGLVETAKALAKVAVVGTVAAMTLVPELTKLQASVGTPPAALGLLMSSSIFGLAQRIALAYVLIGVLDAVYQRRRFMNNLKMSKQEVKDEAKSTELPPEVRGAIRRRQVEAARRRMMAAVPAADVIVTNPTHYAVALKYDGSRPAPTVVAKGKDLVARQIRRIAEEHGVPIIPDPPLARSLHASVELDEMIPAELYEAVAQVLAFIFRIAGRRTARS